MAKIMDVSEQVFKHVRYLNVMQLRNKVPHGVHDQVIFKICDTLENQVNDKIYIQAVQNIKLN